MPKVYEKKKAIRSIIRLKGSIIEIRGHIGKELLRQIIFGLKHFYLKAASISCQDIRNILINTNNSNISFTSNDMPCLLI